MTIAANYGKHANVGAIGVIRGHMYGPVESP